MRVNTALDDWAVAELDRIAWERGIDRTQVMAMAIDQFLDQNQSGPDKLESEVGPSGSESKGLRGELQLANRELEEIMIQAKGAHNLDEQIWNKSGTLEEGIERLRDQMEREMREMEKKELETSEMEDAVPPVVEVKPIDSRPEEVSADLHQAKRDTCNLREVIKAKDDEIAFLRSHISELSQKLTAPALTLSKPWWQFWR
jgi:chromosome segregation ATPase